MIERLEYLKKLGIDNNHIISINLESPDYDFKDYKDLYDYVNKKIQSVKFEDFFDERA